MKHGTPLVAIKALMVIMVIASIRPGMGCATKADFISFSRKYFSVNSFRSGIQQEFGELPDGLVPSEAKVRG